MLVALLGTSLAGCASAPQSSSRLPTQPQTPGTAPVPGELPTAPMPSPDAQRQAEFDKSLERWHGATVKELVAKLGPPKSNTRRPDGSAQYVYAKTAKLNGPTGPVTFSCVVRYTVDERAGRVTGHGIEGC